MSKRVVGFIPSKLNSQRLPRKNVKPLAGVPLVNYALRTLNAVPGIAETMVFSSEREIEQFIRPGLRYTFLQRPAWLDTDAAKAQDFIAEFIKAASADVVVLLHITSPFIRAQTVSECLEQVLSGKRRSAFAAVEERRFAWFQGKPLNYSWDQPTPRTQDLPPVLFEQSGLYVFTKDLFLSTRNRVSDDAYIKVIDAFEGHDIDTPQDFLLAEQMVAAGLLEGFHGE